MWYSEIAQGAKVIRNFGNKAALAIWENDHTKLVPNGMWNRAKALMTIMHATSTLDDLIVKGQPPNIRLHKLKGSRKDEWCITFRFKDGEFIDVQIENYHKG